MPDGAEFLVISRTLEGPQGAYNERVRRTALMLACDIGFRDEVVYGAATTGAGFFSSDVVIARISRPFTQLHSLKLRRLKRPPQLTPYFH